MLWARLAPQPSVAASVTRPDPTTIDRDATMALPSDDGFIIRILWHAGRLDARERAFADRPVDQRRGIEIPRQPPVLGQEVAQPVEFRAVDLELRRDGTVLDDFREIGRRGRIVVL